MKLFKYSTFAIAGLLFAACASNDEVGPKNPSIFDGDNGFVSINIQMPQTGAVTRSNDEFDDGEPIPTEYNVKDATLILFHGAANDEAGAKFMGIYPLTTNFEAYGTTTDQCTSESKASTQLKSADVNKLAAADHLYAYVILNGMTNGLVTTTMVADEPQIAEKLGAYDLDEVSFSDFSAFELATIGDWDKGFVMTNAPCCNKAGGSAAPGTEAKIVTLAEFDQTKIHSSQAEAENDPAADIFVERAAVKIEVQYSATKAELEAKDGLGKTIAYDPTTITWAVGNTEATYYNTRQYDATWNPYVADGSEGTLNADNKYRFVSVAPIHDGVYRTFFGSDPHYADDLPGGTTALATTAFTNAVSTATNRSYVYTTENTFDVDHMTHANTTYVGIKVQLNGGTFYTCQEYGSNYILQPEQVAGKESVRDYVVGKYLATIQAYADWAKVDTNDEDEVEVTLNADNQIASIGLASGHASADLPASVTNAAAIAAVNAALHFTKYTDGWCYYNVRVKHFGAELNNKAETPWDATKHKGANNIANIYSVDTSTYPESTPEKNFLGRYSVVRNNWYILDVAGIRQVGSNVPIPPETIPDDEVDNYIAVKIHVLPWVLRKQSVIL